VALVIGAVLASYPRLKKSRSWNATVTPLASIMGSGFLVSAPLLVALTGNYAPLAMAALLVVAYGVGSVIRFNIRYTEPELAHDEKASRHEHRSFHSHHDRTSHFWAEVLPELEISAAHRLEQASHLVLAAAYLVSVTYYLQLLGVFVLSRLPGSALGLLPNAISQSLPKILTTIVLAFISLLGWRKGLGALERVERYAVALNFGMIAGLLTGLVIYNGHLAATGAWALPARSSATAPLHTVRSLMGLLIIVQGFETSRFLGAEHPAAQRIKTMRWAQLLSAGIYLSFTTLALVLFRGGASPVTGGVDVTAIVTLVGPVAPVLPVLIVIVATASQFSAAVADDAGCSGLTQVFLAHRLPARDGYLLIGATTIALTWGTDVLGIISLASRAFAAFYALQCGVALATALKRPDGRRRPLFVLLCGLLGLVCVAVTILGIPAG
jgi:hypothetical protein